MNYLYFILLLLLIGPNQLYAQESCSELIHDLGSNNTLTDKQVGDIRKLNDKTLLFYANTPDAGRELWVSDGTPAGTHLLKDIFPGSSSSIPEYEENSNEPVVLNGLYYFVANDGKTGDEVWRSDGTASGTYSLGDLYSGSNSSFFGLRNLTVYNNELYFLAPRVTSSPTATLYKTGGTLETTSLVIKLDIRTDMVIFGGLLWFTIYNSETKQFQLLKSNGTPQGTVGTDVRYPDYFTVSSISNQYLLVYTADGFYKSDGTASGTRLIKSRSNSFYTPSPNIYSLNGIAFFYVKLDVNNFSDLVLWRTDGTEAGTYALTKNATDNATVYNGALYYIEKQVRGGIAYGYKLFKSDGTLTGTEVFNDIAPESYAISTVRNLSIGNDGLLYAEMLAGGITAQQAATRNGLWRMDGTAQGSKRLCALGNNFQTFSTISSNTYSNKAFIVANGYVYYIGRQYGNPDYNTGKFGFYKSSLTPLDCNNLAVSVTGGSLLCGVSSLSLSANVSGGTPPYIYQWKLDGQNVGASSVTYSAVTGGSYTLSVSDAKLCSVVSTAKLVLSMPTPTVSLSVDGSAQLLPGESRLLTSITDIGQFFQWYRNGQLIPGATQSQYRAYEDGSYTVAASTNFCSTTSQPIIFNLLLSTLASDGPSVRPYPNPTDGSMTIRLTTKQKGVATFRIIDSMGKVVQSRWLTYLEGVNELSVDMTLLSGGIYYLQIEGTELLSTHKLIKK